MVKFFLEFFLFTKEERRLLAQCRKARYAYEDGPNMGMTEGEVDLLIFGGLHREHARTARQMAFSTYGQRRANVENRKEELKEEFDRAKQACVVAGISESKIHQFG